MILGLIGGAHEERSGAARVPSTIASADVKIRKYLADSEWLSELFRRIGISFYLRAFRIEAVGRDLQRRGQIRSHPVHARREFMLVIEHLIT